MSGSQVSIDFPGQVAQWNGKKKFRLDVEQLPDSPRRSSEPFWRLFSDWRIFRYTFVAAVTWFVASMINYGMFFDVGNLPFDIYATQFILATATIGAELPIAILDTYKPHLIDRRLVLLWFLGISAGFNFLVGALFLTSLPGDPGLNWIFSGLSIAGQATISIVFDTAYVYSIELFPTLLRSTAGAMCSASARLGAIVGPQLLFAATQCESCSCIPYMVFGSFGVVGVVIDYFLLPDTKDKALLENISDELHVLTDSDDESNISLFVPQPSFNTFATFFDQEKKSQN